MSRFSLTIATDNAAFADDDNTGSELARILHALAAEVDGVSHDDLDSLDGIALFDINGNRVGATSYESKD
jgi:hypothetical protein